MRVILRKRVERLGKAGDVVDVKDGYARNNLIPYGLAYPYTEENIRRVEAEKKKTDEMKQYHLSRMRELKEALETLSCTITMRATDEGKLFGSVTAATIAESLQSKGLPIEPGMVELEVPIKELGVYEVVIHLAEEVDAHLRVWVVEEET